MYWDRLLISDKLCFSASDATHDCVLVARKMLLGLLLARRRDTFYAFLAYCWLT